MTAPLSILLVDDHEVVRRGLAALLEGNDEWKVVGEAADGRTAVQLAREMRPDLVVMDVGMPDLNGYEVASRLRARPASAGGGCDRLPGQGSELRPS